VDVSTEVFKVDIEIDKGFFAAVDKGIEPVGIRVFISRRSFGIHLPGDFSNAYVDNVATLAACVPVVESLSLIVKESECTSKYLHYVAHEVVVLLTLTIPDLVYLGFQTQEVSGNCIWLEVLL
jgi:hypothetical protein